MPAQLTAVSSQELTSAIDDQRVVEYIVEGLDPTGPALLIARPFQRVSPRLRLLSAHLQALSCGPFAFGRFRVPQLLASFEAAGAVSSGRRGPLDDKIDEVGSVDGVHNTARWLAKLHMSTVQFRRPRRGVIADTHAWAAAVRRHSQNCLSPLSGWLPSGLRCGPSPPGTQVPIHKDFHAGHVLVGDSVCVIDLDQAEDVVTAPSIWLTSARIWSLDGDGGPVVKPFPQGIFPPDRLV